MNEQSAFVCYGITSYRSGLVLALYRTDEMLRVAIGSDDWQLEIGEQYSLQMKVDRILDRNVNGHVISESLIAIDFYSSDLNRVQRDIARGHVLHIEAAQSTFSFELTGTAALISELERCLQSRQASRNPFARSSPSANNRNPFAQQQPLNRGRSAEIAGLQEFHTRIGTALGQSFEVYEDDEVLVAASEDIIGIVFSGSRRESIGTGQFGELDAIITGLIVSACDQSAARPILVRAESEYSIRLLHCDGDDYVQLVSCERDGNCYAGFYGAWEASDFRQQRSIDELFEPLVSALRGN